MAKQKELMPAAVLDPREGDLDLTADQLGRLGLFAGLKGKTDLEKFPGSLRVRRFAAGDAICRQGEAGWTAFYILTAADVQAVTPAAPASRGAGAKYRRTYDDLMLLPEDAPAEVCATIYLSVPRPTEAPNQGWLGRLNRRLFGGSTPGGRTAARPKFIPIDAPTDVDGESLQAFLREGDLFGEMSCLNRTPRSATIIAARDCYVLEILRNIFEKVKEDANYKKRVEEEYKRRSLDQQLKNIPLFAGLTDAQVNLVRERASLRSYKAGQIVCDEHDRSDEVFLIRSGLVKVVKTESALVAVRDVADWPALVAALRQPAGAAARVAAAVSAPLLAADPAGLTAADKQEIVHALNESVKGPPLWLDPAFKELAAPDAVKDDIARVPPAVAKEWAARPEVRRLNRKLVEATVPGLRKFARPANAPETILAYRARGELIGEIGLLLKRPRGATCVAYIRPEGEKGPRQDLEAVELVHLPAALFEELVQDADFHHKVDAIRAARAASDVAVLARPVTEAAAAGQRSERFEELGLIQGQKLMLIDLDRCTRCDECVRACVNTHSDGRSRLFLDGPRFGQYLVPTTCRSCLDPVCMIGCPVGSIHRGDNNQIVIEDWCIGCEMCARQCPYGAIQMHDTGVIREESYGWRHRPADGLADDGWTAPRFRDRDWRSGKAPFAPTRDFLAGGRPAAAYAFRYEFTLDRDRLGPGGEFKLEVTTPAGADVAVWLDGKPLTVAEAKKDKRTFPAADAAALRPGRHVVAARVSLLVGHAGPFFDLRADVVRRPKGATLSAADYVEKGVTELAVVCDMCSTLPGQRPACVRACPHDAAMRVDARTNFPA